MPLSRELLGSSHLEHIEAAIQELFQLAKRAAEPAPLPQQYVGTIVDNAASLLTVPASALDGKSRIPIPSEDRTWFSMMVAVHRAFLPSLQVAIEEGLAHMCERLGIPVVSGVREKSASLASRVRSKVDSAPIEAELREIERMGSAQPAFDDYLHPVLAKCFSSAGRRRTWTRFFRALSIARNKASHADQKLTQTEIQDLKAGGLGAMVDQRGALQINPRMYVQLARSGLEFFDEALRGMPAKPPA